MKRILITILMFFIIIIYTSAHSSSLNWLTKGQADSLYAPIDTIYGEMYNYSSTGYSFDIDDAGVYYNLTGLVAGNLNGFTFENNNQANGGSRLVAQESGIYKLDFSMSFSSIANGGLFGISLTHTGDPDKHRNCYSRREATIETGNVGVTCIMDLEVGEKVNILIENENTNRDITIQTINLNLIKIAEMS